MTAQLVSLNIGAVSSLVHASKSVPSAFVKQPVIGSHWVQMTGLVGDQQADLIHHGGFDKAICVYPLEHYSFFAEKLLKPVSVPAFGENFSVRGLLESKVCIGDIYEIGEALLQVSQPRQPCFKLGSRHNNPQLPILVLESGLTGFYFRVLKPGFVSVGQTLKLHSRSRLGVLVAEANRIMHHDRNNKVGIQQILSEDSLSQSWRETLSTRLMGISEERHERLSGHKEL